MLANLDYENRATSLLTPEISHISFKIYCAMALLFGLFRRICGCEFGCPAQLRFDRTASPSHLHLRPAPSSRGRGDGEYEWKGKNLKGATNLVRPKWESENRPFSSSLAYTPQPIAARISPHMAKVSRNHQKLCIRSALYSAATRYQPLEPVARCRNPHIRETRRGVDYETTPRSRSATAYMARCEASQTLMSQPNSEPPLAANSGPLSLRMRHRARRSRASTSCTSGALITRRVSKAKHSRAYSSINVNHVRLGPSPVRSKRMSYA